MPVNLGPEPRDDYTRICMELFDRSRSVFAPYYQKLQRFYDSYRRTQKSRANPQWNDVSSQLLFSVVQSDAARKMAILFGGNPILSFVPMGGEDNEKARRAERLVDLQLSLCQSYEKAVRFIINADLFGTSIYQWGWNKQLGVTRRREGAIGVLANSPQTGSQNVRKNGPDWNLVDQTDFFPYPGMIDIQEMPGVVFRYRMEFEDVRANGELSDDGDPPVFDARGVRELGETPPNPQIADERIWRRDPNSATGELSWSQMREFSKPVEIVEYWGRVPEYLAVEDPLTGAKTQEVVISVADRRVLLRAAANPFWNKRKPFGAYRPLEDPYFFYSPGKVEVAEKLQAAINKMANTKLDALDLFIAPPWLYNENSGLNTRKMFAGPGVFIGMNGPVDEAQIRQLSPDLRGLQTAFQEGEYLWRLMQQSTGSIEDVSQGISSAGSDRQTAHEFEGRAAAVNTRLGLEARLAEVQWLEPLGNAFVEMNKQYLPIGTEVKMLGTHAAWDEISERFVPPDQFSVSQDDLNGDYDIRATGATRTMSKQSKVMNMQAALQGLAMNPQIAATVNWRIFVRQYLGLLDFTNVDQVMNTEQQAQQALQLELQLTQKLQQGGQQQSAVLPFMEQLSSPFQQLGAANG